ncbi:MAG: hypothetical protein ACKPKO_50785, partial [Candidatus Fonsibacter sp.]
RCELLLEMSRPYTCVTFTVMSKPDSIAGLNRTHVDVPELLVDVLERLSLRLAAVGPDELLDAEVGGIAPSTRSPSLQP